MKEYLPIQQVCNGTLAICAASSRWLAESASRLGLKVIAYDLFADWDTQQVCQVTRLSKLADFSTHKSAFTGDFLIAGGLETNLGTWKPLSKRKGWKNANWESIEHARNPFFWTSKLRESGFPTVDSHSSTHPEMPGRWVRKKLHSSGGMGIKWHSPVSHPLSPTTEFVQKFVDGQPMSSLHVSNGKATKTLGLFIQWTGNPNLSYTQCDQRPGFADLPRFAPKVFGAKPFQFAGAIGPIDETNYQPALDHTASTIAGLTGIQGVFGIDWIETNQAMLVPIEINPRLTATGDLWERSSGGNIVSEHLQTLAGEMENAPRPTKMTGKAILFTDAEELAVTQGLHSKMRTRWQSGLLGDIPCPETRIPPGYPITTVYADPIPRTRDKDLSDLAANMVQRASAIRNWISENPL